MCADGFGGPTAAPAHVPGAPRSAARGSGSRGSTNSKPAKPPPTAGPCGKGRLSAGSGAGDGGSQPPPHPLRTRLPRTGCGRWGRRGPAPGPAPGAARRELLPGPPGPTRHCQARGHARTATAAPAAPPPGARSLCSPDAIFAARELGRRPVPRRPVPAAPRAPIRARPRGPGRRHGEGGRPQPGTASGGRSASMAGRPCAEAAAAKADARDTAPRPGRAGGAADPRPRSAAARAARPGGCRPATPPSRGSRAPPRGPSPGARPLARAMYQHSEVARGRGQPRSHWLARPGPCPEPAAAARPAERAALAAPRVRVGPSPLGARAACAPPPPGRAGFLGGFCCAQSCRIPGRGRVSLAGFPGAGYSVTHDCPPTRVPYVTPGAGRRGPAPVFRVQVPPWGGQFAGRLQRAKTDLARGHHP